MIFEYAAVSKHRNLAHIDRVLTGGSSSTLNNGFYQAMGLIHAHVFEPVRPTVFLEEEPFAIRETARNAAFTLG